MQDFTDKPGFPNLSRPRRMFVVGLVLIGWLLVIVGSPFGPEWAGPTLGFDLMLFAAIYALVHELDAVKRQLRNVQQVTNTETVNIACQTVNVIDGDKQ